MTQRFLLFALSIFLAVLLLDQWSKRLILEQFTSYDHAAIEVTSFFNIVLVWNTGVSFGLFASHRQPLLLTAVSAVIIIMLVIWLMKNTSKLVAASLGCVIGGAVANVIDRLRFGAVTDFLDFHIGAYHWPAFNVADSCIFIGVVLLSVSSMFAPNSQTKDKESSS